VVAVTVPRKISTIEELVSKRRLQKQRPQSRETVLGLCPGKGGSWSSETNHDMRTALRPALFISKWSLHKQRPQSPKLFCVRVLVKMDLLARKQSKIDVQHEICPWLSPDDYRFCSCS
jgi:hypothetical protein